MTLTKRRILFVLIIGIFAVITPVLILYALGWRYNFEQGGLRKVGSLVIESQPENATVSLDGTILKKNTPLTLNTILPGSYDLMIGKEGFYDWSKPISISSSRTTRQKAILLRRSTPITLHHLSDNFFSVSPSGDYLAYTDGNALIIAPTASPAQKNVINISSRPTALHWSTVNHWVSISLANGQRLAWLFDSDKSPLDLTAMFGKNLTILQWSRTERNIIFAFDAHHLLRLNVLQKTHTKLPHPMTTIYIDDNLYFFKTDSDLIVSDDQLNNLAILPISTNDHLSFFPRSDNQIPILNATEKKLLYYDISTQSFHPGLDNYSGIIIAKGHEFTLLYNTNEISFLHKNGDEEFLTRTTEQIKKAFPLADNAYALYLTADGKLTALERSEQNRNTYSLKLPPVSDIWAISDNSRQFVVATDTELILLSL